MERAHDRGEEGEDRKHDELHDWGVRGGILWGRAARRKRGSRGYLYETGMKEEIPSLR